MFFRSLVNFISSVFDLCIKLVGLFLVYLVFSYWQDMSIFGKFVVEFFIFLTILGTIQTFIEKMKK